MLINIKSVRRGAASMRCSRREKDLWSLAKYTRSGESRPGPRLSLGNGAPACENGLMQANPLLRASPLPYQLPQFDHLENQHYREAFAQGMSAQLREVAVITGQ